MLFLAAANLLQISNIVIFCAISLSSFYSFSPLLCSLALESCLIGLGNCTFCSATVSMIQFCTVWAASLFH